jgi:hypothetical protein
MSARARLRIAQVILLFIGAISLGLNLYLLLNAEGELQEARQAGVRVGADTVRVVYGVYITGTALGAVFLILGLVVWKAPLPVTIAGLLLYVVGNLGILSYTNFAGGAANYVKVFFALALARAISDAAAYERERYEERRKRRADNLKEVQEQSPGRSEFDSTEERGEDRI